MAIVWNTSNGGSSSRVNGEGAMRSMRIFVAAACCALWPSLAVGQGLDRAEPQTLDRALKQLWPSLAVGQGLDRFKLFADCEPMGLVVEGLPEDAAEIGLTEDSIRAAAESRLRSARLYIEASSPYLYINVNVLAGAFNVALEYNKSVFDPLSGLSGVASTWSSGGTGTHGRDSGFILSQVSQHLDRFLAEFLRVNEAACGKQ